MTKKKTSKKVSEPSRAAHRYFDYGGYSRSPGRRPVTSSFEGVESMTKQQFKEECDINNLVAKYTQLGQLPPIDASLYSDAHEMDFHQAMNLMKKTEEHFNGLPPELQAEFGTPANFAEQVSNPDNFETLAAIGMFGPQFGPEMPPQTPSQAHSGDISQPEYPSEGPPETTPENGK